MTGLEDAFGLALQPLDHCPGGPGEAGGGGATEVRGPGLDLRAGEAEADKL